MSELCEKPSHYASVRSLDEWMTQQNVPGICGVDTRALTKHIRSKGCLSGKIIVESDNTVVEFEGGWCLP